MYNYKEYLKTIKNIKKEISDDYINRNKIQNKNIDKPQIKYSEEDKLKMYKFWFDIIKNDKIIKIIEFIKHGFLKNILDINKVDDDNNSGLMLACRYNNEEIVNRILDIPNVNTNIKNKDGKTELMLAINFKIIKKLLIQPSIDLFLTDNDDKNFLDYYTPENSIKYMLSSYTLQKEIIDNNVDNIFIFLDYNLLNDRLIPYIISKNPEFEDIFKDLTIGDKKQKNINNILDIDDYDED
jgi:hypothetical protein